MNTAEEYKQQYLMVSREDEPELPDDMYYITDIIGSDVVDTEGNELGKIYDVIQTKNNDVYWIRKPKELLIPVLEDIVLEINVEEKKVIIEPVRQWLDED